MDAKDADRALESVLADLETTSTTDIASNPHSATCKIMVALVLIGRRLVPARSSATDETMPGKRGTFRSDPPWPVVRDRIEGRDADLAAKDRAELAAALTKLETAERTVATLQNTLAERDLKIDRLSFDLARAERERDKAAATAAASVDAISDARRELAAWIDVTGDVPALPDVVERTCRRIAVLLEEHQRERTKVDQLRAQVAGADTEADRIAQDRDALKQSLEQAISDGTALASEVRGANATIAELRKLVCEAQVERDMAVNEMCEWRNAHARARLAAWEILHPGVPLKGDRTLAQLLDDVREAEAAARRESERCDDLIEYVLAWYRNHAAQDEHDARLRTAVDEWLKEPTEAGSLLAEQLESYRSQWDRIQPLIRALHAWENADTIIGAGRDLRDAFEAWQKAEAEALDAEEAKPTPALSSLFGGPPVHVDEPVGAFADVHDDGPVDLPRQPDDPGVESRRLTRDEAIEIARRAAAGPHRPTYYEGPDFQPHEWVIDAMLQLATSLGARVDARGL